MIKANELRVGNKYVSCFGNIETVLSIVDNTDKGRIKVCTDCHEKQQIHYKSEQHREMYSHLILCWENGNAYKPCEISGVPLTAEWLEKLGFSDKEYKDGYIGIDVNNTDFTLTKPNPGSNSITEKNYTFHCTYGGWPRYIAFEYVHELQNFFFAIHGKELIVK